MKNHRSGGVFASVTLNPEYDSAVSAQRSDSILKTCAICQTSLGLGLGILHAKKYTWYCPPSKFCHRDVCQQCSPSRKFHPDLQSVVRICDPCFRSDIAATIAQGANATISQIQESIATAVRDGKAAEVETRNVVERQTQLRNEIPKLQKRLEKHSVGLLTVTNEKKITLRDLVEQGEELRKEVKELTVTVGEIRKKRGEVEKTLKDRMEELETSRVLVSDTKAQLGQLQDETQTLRSLFDYEKSRAVQREEKSPDKHSLKSSLKELKSKETEKRRELDFTKERISYIRKEIDTRENDIKALSQGKPAPVSSSLLQLESELAEIQRENQSLSRQLEDRAETGSHYATSSQFSEE